MAKFEPTDDDREWLAQQFEALTTTVKVRRPSEWAEDKRTLPLSSAQLPGPYRFEVTPYLREIVDCLSPESPVREIALMKGVQIGATVGVLENFIGYSVEHVKTSPMMMITADAELAKLRVETSIIPMLQLSELDDLIRSSDEKNPRKTGRTDKKIEWVGGGFLIPFGAQNANKLRSIPIQVLLRDEIDGWPDTVGKDGDPLKLSFDRTATFELSRKILDISTPLIRTSKIEQQFLRGDQRRYHVCCVKCGFAQVLRWRTSGQSGEVGGIVWDMDGGRLVPDSARYLCQNPDCQHAHYNDDKTRLLSPEYGAEWRATAIPVAPHIRSYHLSALYSPVGMQSWDACVQKWIEAWDIEKNAMRDMSALQVFYNNVLGEPFEVRGERVRFDAVSAHRRHSYQYGEIPNSLASSFCGGPVALLVCTVDVHADNLAVAVWGWCRDHRAILVDYWRFECEKTEKSEDEQPASTERLDDPRTWGRLRDLIETREYIADDGRRYRIQLTLIDSGYRADDVYRFCSEYDAGVYPVKGQAASQKTAAQKEFSALNTPMGRTAYGISVDLYKDRWSASLRRNWDGLETQPVGHFNAPMNATDGQLKELTAETKREKRVGNRTVGWEWHRPSGAKNELWDLLIYANAALDIVAWDVCRNQLALDNVNANAFFDVCENQQLFFTK